MTMPALADERTALDLIENRLKKDGYTLVRSPGPEQLPAFLRGFRPDAIAVGADPSLVIEVMHSRTASATTQIRQINSLLSGHEDWRLEVVYVSPDGTAVGSTTPEEVRATLRGLQKLSEIEPRGALLLAWSSMEAIGRILQPALAARSISPNSLIDLLISHGHASQGDGPLLRRLGNMRNAISHGQLSLTPSSEDLAELLRIAERLVETSINPSH
ncbi:MAG: hypothetical protein RLO51_03645 [Thalassobaculum sp.]|uniref:hypothetical protein n=1 Tax=Thalassobaculum sp. TaxID=2022740 RepID=UPI0032EF1693